MMTVKETATYMNRTEVHIYRLLRENRLDGTKNAKGEWEISVESADHYLSTKGKKRVGRKRVLLNPCVEQIPALHLFCELHGIPFNRSGYYRSKVA